MATWRHLPAVSATIHVESHVPSIFRMSVQSLVASPRTGRGRAHCNQVRKQAVGEMTIGKRRKVRKAIAEKGFGRYGRACSCTRPRRRTCSFRPFLRTHFVFNIFQALTFCNPRTQSRVSTAERHLISRRELTSHRFALVRYIDFGYSTLNAFAE